MCVVDERSMISSALFGQTMQRFAYPDARSQDPIGGCCSLGRFVAPVPGSKATSAAISSCSSWASGLSKRHTKHRFSW